MAPTTDPLLQEDEELLAACDVHAYKASGPGGQHRNKVSSAIRLHHRPTGISAHGDDSRSQHENKRLALNRLRMNLALQRRRTLDPRGGAPPEIVRRCLHRPKKSGQKGLLRLEVGRRDRRFWPVAAYLLDLLTAFEGRLSEAAGFVGISTSNLVRVLRSERHLLGAAQEIRRRFGQSPIR